MELLQLACAPLLSSALTAAARLGIADLLQTHPMAPEDIARATDSEAGAISRLLGALTVVNIFQQLDDGRFDNTELSEHLRSNHPASVRHFCILAGTEYYRAFGDVMHSVRTGQSAFHHVFGSSIYEYMDAHPEAGEVYDRAMEDLTRQVGNAVADAVDLQGLEFLVDVGGGSGSLLRAFLEKHPRLRAMCLERAGVCARARQVGNDGIEFRPGDFFREVPPGADVYLLKNVLHNWNYESSMRILRIIRRAFSGESDRRPKQRLVVIEPLLHEGCINMPPRMGDLFQMLICEQGTARRSEQQLREWLEDAEFEVSRVHILSGGHAVIESIARE